jgi:hypothetical protein
MTNGLIRTEATMMHSTRGETIYGQGPLSLWERLRDKRYEPVNWTVPYEAFTSSVWSDVPLLDRLVQANWRIVYRTDCLENGVKLYGFDDYRDQDDMGPAFRHGGLPWAADKESPINHGMNVTEYVKGSGFHNFGYKVWVEPGTELRLYQVQLELRWQ